MNKLNNNNLIANFLDWQYWNSFDCWITPNGNSVKISMKDHFKEIGSIKMIVHYISEKYEDLYFIKNDEILKRFSLMKSKFSNFKISDDIDIIYETLIEEIRETKDLLDKFSGSNVNELFDLPYWWNLLSYAEIRHKTANYCNHIEVSPNFEFSMEDIEVLFGYEFKYLTYNLEILKESRRSCIICKHHKNQN